MPLRDLLHKKDRIEKDESEIVPSTLPQASEFTFIRTDTHTEERIAPPVFSGDSAEASKDNNGSPRRRSLFGKSPKGSPVRSRDASPPSTREKKRLSERFHLSRERAGSTNLPADLPAIEDAYGPDGDSETKEAQWEERATRLASKSPVGSAFPSGSSPGISNLSLNEDGAASRSPSRRRSISDANADVDIQEAIRLHESGSLEEATRMFGALAERGNVLSQVLYGLSLRHGWGCSPSPEKAITYLSAAASNSAEIERQALAAGMKKGGAAKGELVLAIFELANCFRYGWGCSIDKVAARQYYETAANLGDTDAMGEAAWCYLEGFGGPKDKVRFITFLFCLARISGSSFIRPTIQRKNVVDHWPRNAAWERCVRLNSASSATARDFPPKQKPCWTPSIRAIQR
ncbi:hypothetical protein DV736_g3451, partial [Chaetothyriales sp. CBS 134916]